MELRNFRRARQLYSAGRPSRWASAHILVIISTHRQVKFRQCEFLSSLDDGGLHEVVRIGNHQILHVSIGAYVTSAAATVKSADSTRSIAWPAYVFTAQPSAGGGYDVDKWAVIDMARA